MQLETIEGDKVIIPVELSIEVYNKFREFYPSTYQAKMVEILSTFIAERPKTYSSKKGYRK